MGRPRQASPYAFLPLIENKSDLLIVLKVRVHPRRNHREPCQFWTLVPIEQKVCIILYTYTSSQEFNL